MTEFQKNIVNKLLTLYENTAQSWKSDVKSRVVRLNVEKEPLFNNYVNSTVAYLYRDEINKDLFLLEAQSIVKANKDKMTGLVKTIDLNKKKINEAYALVKRMPLNDKLFSEKEVIRDLLHGYSWSSILTEYLRYLQDFVENHKSRKSYYESIEELKLNVEIVAAIEKQEEDVFLRVFSKKRFGNSKLVERRESRLLQIFNNFGNTSYDNFADLLDDYHIVKNKGNAIAKQGMVFKIHNQIIDLDALGEEFYFSMDMLMKMEIIDIRKPKIITVENLTNFYLFNDENAIILYLGGFHNTAKRELIRKISAFNPKLDFYHTGDIDCGGFEILLDLRSKTGINFKPLFMSISQIEKYKNECQKLTENDKQRLGFLLESTEAMEFKKTIEYMLENDLKLEQESIE